MGIVCNIGSAISLRSGKTSTYTTNFSANYRRLMFTGRPRLFPKVRGFFPPGFIVTRLRSRSLICQSFPRSGGPLISMRIAEYGRSLHGYVCAPVVGLWIANHRARNLRSSAICKSSFRPPGNTDIPPMADDKAAHKPQTW